MKTLNVETDCVGQWRQSPAENPPGNNNMNSPKKNPDTEDKHRGKPRIREEFVRELLGCQDAVYSYIRSLVPRQSDAEDVLQQTNTVLLRKADEFNDVEDLTSWSCRVAYFEVLAYRTRQKRDRLLFDDGLVRLLADEAVSYAVGAERQAEALRHCLAAES